MPKNKKQILSMRMFDSFKLQVDAYHLVLPTGGWLPQVAHRAGFRGNFVGGRDGTAGAKWIMAVKHINIMDFLA